MKYNRGLFVKFGILDDQGGLIRHAKFQECRSNSFWVMGGSKVARNGLKLAWYFLK